MSKEKTETPQHLPVLIRVDFRTVFCTAGRLECAHMYVFINVKAYLSLVSDLQILRDSS